MEAPDDQPSTGSQHTAGYHAPADADALADVSAGRLIDSDAVAQWLGGWHLARAGDGTAVSGFPDPVSGSNAAFSDRAVDDLAPPSATIPSQSRPVVQSDNDPVPRPSLMWTDTAICECDRLRQTVARLGRGTDDRLAEALVGAMVRLIVDGADCQDGIADVALLPTLSLRIVSINGKMIVIGPRLTDAIV